MADTVDEFEAENERRPAGGAGFVVDIDGFEGPIDLLLSMARNQKLDLTQISILALADQYLAFMAEVQQRDLELAADYLVMAAWLAYLKSRLLLPDLDAEGEPSGEQLAQALAFQLQRLEAMQEAGARLMARSRLGHDFFARGDPERFAATERSIIDVTLHDLLAAYGSGTRRKRSTSLTIEAFDLYTVEDALDRLRALIGRTPEWTQLWRYLPANLRGGLMARSAVASTLSASLELAKAGKLRLRQTETFGPIYLRSADDARKRE